MIRKCILLFQYQYVAARGQVICRGDPGHAAPDNDGIEMSAIHTHAPSKHGVNPRGKSPASSHTPVSGMLSWRTQGDDVPDIRSETVST